jgi:hypothetical protein
MKTVILCTHYEGYLFEASLEEASRVTPQSYFFLHINSGYNSGFNSNPKVSSLYNTGHNKRKELLPTKLQFNVAMNH